MDVRMPDGTIVKNVPDGITKAQLLEKYRNSKIASGMDEMKQEATDAALAPVIAAGKTANDFNQGVRQSVFSAVGDQQGLSDLKEQQDEAARLYEPLKQKHPFLTGVGEALPYVATPVGQTSAAGRVLAPAVTAAAVKGMSYGTPEERLTGAATHGALAAGGGVAGEALRFGVAPAQSVVSKAQRDAISGLEKRLGVKARPSQLTGNQNLANLEDALANSPGGAGVWREFLEGNKAALNKAASESIGSNADAPTRAVLNAEKSRLGSEYDALRKATEMPVIGDVFDAINKSEQMLSRGAGIKGKDEALGTLSQLKEKLWNSKKLSGEDYQAWTSDLATMARETKNATVKTALRGVEKAMDRAARTNNAAKWEAADAQWASLKALLRPNSVNEVTGDVSPRGVYQALQVAQGEANKLGKVDGPLRDVADFGKALPQLREGSQTAKRGMFTDAASWLMAPGNYALSKALTSDLGRNYIARGLLGSPSASQKLGRVLEQGQLPLSMTALQFWLGERQ